MADREELEQKNKDELLEHARERELEGRSSMNKEELVNALADDGSSDSNDGSVSEGGSEVRDAEDLLTPTGPYRGDQQSEAEATLSAGNPVPGEESEDGGSQGAEERMDALEEKTPVAADLAAEEMDFAGPLHLQSPEERIMTGAVSEEQAEEQKKLLENKPDDHVGNVTEAGFDEDGNSNVRRVSVVEPVEQYAIDYKENALQADKEEAKDSSSDE